MGTGRGPSIRITPPALALIVAIGAAALAVAIPFAVCTTFIGDDHLFLAFARYAPNPLVAFVRDQHGGEFYRPLPMLLWWALARLAPGAEWPFAASAFALHALVAAEAGLLVARVGGDRRAGVLAGLFFFVSPFNREAAYWYAASTDLLAAAAGLGAIHALLGAGRATPAVAALLVAAACLSKESAVVVPLLAVLVLRVGAREGARSWRAVARRVAPMAIAAVAYAAARAAVLGSIGGTGDVVAPFPGKLLQIASGLVHALGAAEVLAPPVAWVVGVGGWIAVVAAVWRERRRPAADDAAPAAPPLWLPLGWIAVAGAPLLAAPWVVGSRYFYLGAVGVAWLVGVALRRAPVPVAVAVLGFLVGLGVAQDRERHAEVALYRARVAAARRAVLAGLADGHATFHVAAGVKDLDLAVKEDPRLGPREDDLLVLGDVPASFVAVPRGRPADLDFLLARPPLPPSGAYRFGDRRIVGLARRGDDPTLDEVIRRLPDIRFIRLEPGPTGLVIPRDVTEAVLRPEDPEPDDPTAN